MRYAYPARTERSEHGDWVVSFRDVPEALTGASTFEEALALASDCLTAGLGTYVDGQHPRPIPAPSAPLSGEHVIALPSLVAAKLALHQAMRDQGLTAAALAARSGTAETALRRLLDLDHRSHIGGRRERCCGSSGEGSGAPSNPEVVHLGCREAGSNA